MISTAQIRAARGLLNWSQGDLADRTGISQTSIGNLEKGATQPRETTLQTIKEILEGAGINFTDNGGVEPRQTPIRLYEGPAEFKRFMDDVYTTAKEHGGDICIFNTTPENWLNLLGEEWCQMHYRRMMEIRSLFHFRAITKQRNDLLIGQGFIEYRWIPENLFNEKTFYCYGDKLAFLDFKNDTVMVWVIEHPGFASGFRTLFQISWDHVAIKPLLDPEKDVAKPKKKK